MIYKQLTAYILKSPERHETGTPGEHGGVGCIVEHLGGLVAIKSQTPLMALLLVLCRKKNTISFYILPVCHVAHRLDLAVLMRLAGSRWSSLLMS